jgi:hypothetical protein
MSGLAKARVRIENDRPLLESQGSKTKARGTGARPSSCRFINAASGCLSSAEEWSATTEWRSGLRVTGPMGEQLRVVPDRIAGLRSRASM